MEDSDDLQENGFGRILEVKGGWSVLGEHEKRNQKGEIRAEDSKRRS